MIVFFSLFPHRKTYDFVSILVSKGYENLWLIAAPKVNLKHNKNTDFSNNHNLSKKYNVKNLCKKFNLNFCESAHDDKIKISKIIHDSGAKTALISGARIIKKEIIEMFPNGIINFHPGKIPETSGLDSFFYSIKTNSPMGVTVHIIDDRVDAGFFIFFEKVKIALDDTLESVKEKVYEIQLCSLSKYLDTYFGKKINFPPINRPRKNIPLSQVEKDSIILKFPIWKREQIEDITEPSNYAGNPHEGLNRNE